MINLSLISDSKYMDNICILTIYIYCYNGKKNFWVRTGLTLLSRTPILAIVEKKIVVPRLMIISGPQINVGWLCLRIEFHGLYS